jgi:hypothetical protein
METWECEQCGGQIFIAEVNRGPAHELVYWSHLENTDCDDPEPMDFVQDRDLTW